LKFRYNIYCLYLAFQNEAKLFEEKRNICFLFITVFYVSQLPQRTNYLLGLQKKSNCLVRTLYYLKLDHKNTIMFNMKWYNTLSRSLANFYFFYLNYFFRIASGMKSVSRKREILSAADLEVILTKKFCLKKTWISIKFKFYKVVNCSI